VAVGGGIAVLYEREVVVVEGKFSVVGVVMKEKKIVGEATLYIARSVTQSTVLDQTE